MLLLTDSIPGLTLLRWTEELPSDSAQDPLGLKLRLSARLAAELLHCITSITPRARYFAFFPWAVGQYLTHEKDTACDRGRDHAVLHRERALALGSLLHHGDRPCLGGGLAGSLAARPVADGGGLIDLAAWRHLKNPRGILGQAYKGSLVNLGLFEAGSSGQPGEAVADDAADGGELTVAVQEMDLVRLSDRGRRIAQAYCAAVDATRYVAEGWHLRTAVPEDVLREFGAAGCLCGISQPGAHDRDALRDAFFAVDRAGTDTAHHRRRMTLTLLLECARRANEAGADLDENAFATIAYEGAFDADATGTRVRVDLPTPLQDVAQRWRIFVLHGLASVALQALLVAVVRALRDQPGGLRRPALPGALYYHAQIAVERLFALRLATDFLDLSPAETLQALGVDALAALSDRAAIPFIERELARRLTVGREAERNGCAHLAAALLFTVLLRYRASVAAAYDGWHRNHVYDSWADLSLPGILEGLDRWFGADGFWLAPNREVLDHVIWRFVVQQHQTMSMDRGFASSPLLHVDGETVIGTAADFSDPSSGNVRFDNALQILRDLGLLDTHGTRPTPDGEAWLGRVLQEQRRR